jgi:hypothetical protein
MSDPEPLPVVVLPDYPLVATSHHPGVVGFVGTTSIIIAALSLAVGAGSLFLDFGFIVTAQAARTVAAMPVAPVVASGSVTTGASPERVPTDGLGLSLRQNVAAGLTRARALSPEQLTQLDELLAEHGKVIFPSEAGFAPAELASTIARTGHRAFTGTAGSDYFVLGEGQLELSSDRAVFFPANQQPAIRSKAIEIPVPAAASPTALTPDQIRSVLRTIDDLNGAKIKSAQRSAIVRQLQSTGETEVIPTTDGSDPAWEVASAATDSSGTLTVSFTRNATVSTIAVDPAGVLSQNAAAVSQAVRVPTANTTAAATSMALAGVQLLLAIYLLVAGIITLRGSGKGRMLHWIYVGLKFPIALAMAGSAIWLWSSVIGSTAATRGGGTPGMIVSVGFGGVPALLGCVYPIVLVFVLRSAGAKRYYGDGPRG